VSEVKEGGCLCGAVRYRVVGPLREIVACHCTQCRKTSGHYVAATRCRSSDLVIEGSTLTWFKSSDTAERAFCGRCGSNLFWRRFESKFTSIFAGTIDGDTELLMGSQIHTESKGDYYALPDIPVISQSLLR
jgi:hypothetical protein